jgi:hypothetical protein
MIEKNWNWLSICHMFTIIRIKTEYNQDRSFVSKFNKI